MNTFLVLLSLIPLTFAAPAVKSTAASPMLYARLDQALKLFEADLQKKKVYGLKDLSIRSVTLSKGMPEEFKSQLELLVSKRVVDIAHTRVVHCIACLEVNQTYGSKLTANEMKIAKVDHLQNFLDIQLLDSPEALSLSFYVQKAQLKPRLVVWKKTYHAKTAIPSPSPATH